MPARRLRHSFSRAVTTYAKVHYSDLCRICRTTGCLDLLQLWTSEDIVELVRQNENNKVNTNMSATNGNNGMQFNLPKTNSVYVAIRCCALFLK